MDIIDTVWDGVEFLQLPRKEAKKLEKQDKVQILSDGFVDGLALKYRHEFSGYETRELRAKKPPAAPKKVAKKPEPEPPAETAVDWREHRKAAAAALKKPFNKTTKADTLKYLEGKS